MVLLLALGMSRLAATSRANGWLDVQVVFAVLWPGITYQPNSGLLFVVATIDDQTRLASGADLTKLAAPVSVRS